MRAPRPAARMRETPLSWRQLLGDSLLDLDRLLGVEPRVAFEHAAIAADQEARRHDLDVERAGRLSLRIERDAERRRVLREECVGGLALLVEVDRDDREPPVPVLL